MQLHISAFKEGLLSLSFPPSSLFSLFGVDGVVFVDPELVKGKKGEEELLVLRGRTQSPAGSGRRHL